MYSLCYHKISWYWDTLFWANSPYSDRKNSDQSLCSLSFHRLLWMQYCTVKQLFQVRVILSSFTCSFWVLLHVHYEFFYVSQFWEFLWWLETVVKFEICAFSKWFSGLMDGWMTCDVMSFSTVFQSYQDNERLIMKGCVQWNPVYGWEDFASSWDRTRDS